MKTNNALRKIESRSSFARGALVWLLSTLKPMPRRNAVKAGQPSTRWLFALLLVATFNIFTSTLFAQGSLTPPGTPAPTMKSLDQIASTGIAINATNTPGDSTDLFNITQPGSYFLSGNITGVSGKSGIRVAASHVTIDLNGFNLNGGNVGRSGIFVATGAFSDIEIRNGTISNWGTAGSSGIQAVNATRVRVTDVHVVDCLIAGIVIGSDSTVKDCIAEGNGLDGIEAGDGCAIKDCIVSGNAVNGIFVSGSGVVIQGCVARANTGGGIVVTDNSLITKCTISQNHSDGISLGDRCEVIDCTSNGNGNGANGSGIVAGLRTLVKNCNASENQKNGIVILGASLVLENNVGHNGLGGAAAGIDASGSSGSRIEANIVRNNNGIGILGASNDVIIRNYSFSNTTNYNPTSGNNFGPIEIPNTSTHPTANF